MKLSSHHQKSINAVIAAREEAAEVRKLNAPTREENRRRSQANTAIVSKILHEIGGDVTEADLKKAKNLAKTRPGYKPLLRLPFQLSATSKSVFDKERKALKSLRKLTGAQWAKRVFAVPAPARARVACLVWWDFFGDREVPERWDHLDSLIEGPQDYSIPSETIFTHLVACGYTPMQAMERLSGVEQQPVLSAD